MDHVPEPGSWRLDFNDFERDVAYAILQNPKLECLDMMLAHDVDGTQTVDRSVPLSRADIVRIMLLSEKEQRQLHRKFFFETIIKVRTKSKGEFPDIHTMLVDVDAFQEKHLLDLARAWLLSHGYEQTEFLWGPRKIAMEEG